MKRLWGRLYKNNKILKDVTVNLDARVDEDGFFVDLLEDTAVALRELCGLMDIENPIWLEGNTDEFQRRKKTTFISGNFMDFPDFDRFVIQVIEAP